VIYIIKQLVESTLYLDMIIITTTKSDVKINAIKQALEPLSIITYSTENAQLPAQPINTGLLCCNRRIDHVKNMNDDIKSTGYDYIISIENGIDTIDHYGKGGNSNNFVDICYVVIEDKLGNRQEYESIPILIPRKYVEQARKATSPNYQYSDLGYEYSAGNMINNEFPHINSANWMADPMFGGFSRIDQIISAFDAMI
jgi:non-canonical (house-cleaning) NTP pyrophosphatase